MGNQLLGQIQNPNLNQQENPKGLGPMLYKQLESMAPANPIPEASKKAGPGYHSQFMNINRL